MVETFVSKKANMYPQLYNGMQFRRKIWERETVSKTLSKCIAMFDYFDKTLLVLSATSCSVFVSFAIVAATTVGITS